MEETKTDNIEATINQEPSTDAVLQATDAVLQEPKEVAVAEHHEDNAASANFIKLREAKERLERENAEMAAKLQQHESQVQKKPAEEESTFGDEDLMEGRHLKASEKRRKKELDEIRKQIKDQSDESRLKSTYSDFYKVVNNETLSRLKELDPESAETIATSQASLYMRGASTYKRIKELGIFVDDKHKADREKAEANAVKPRPLNSVSPQQADSPLSMANAFAGGLTPELKAQLWKETCEAAKKA